MWAVRRFRFTLRPRLPILLETFHRRLVLLVNATFWGSWPVPAIAVQKDMAEIKGLLNQLLVELQKGR